MHNLQNDRNPDAMFIHGRNPAQVVFRFPLDMDGIDGSNNYKHARLLRLVNMRVCLGW